MTKDPASPHPPPRSSPLSRVRVSATLVAVGVLYWSLTTTSHLIFSTHGPATTNAADALRDMVRDTPAENWDLGNYSVSSFAGFHAIDSAVCGRWIQVPEWAIGTVVGAALALTFWHTRGRVAH